MSEKRPKIDLSEEPIGGDPLAFSDEYADAELNESAALELFATAGYDEPRFDRDDEELLDRAYRPHHSPVACAPSEAFRQIRFASATRRSGLTPSRLTSQRRTAPMSEQLRMVQPGDRVGDPGDSELGEGTVLRVRGEYAVVDWDDDGSNELHRTVNLVRRPEDTPDE